MGKEIGIKCWERCVRNMFHHFEIYKANELRSHFYILKEWELKEAKSHIGKERSKRSLFKKECHFSQVCMNVITTYSFQHVQQIGKNQIKTNSLPYYIYLFLVFGILKIFS